MCVCVCEREREREREREMFLEMLYLYKALEFRGWNTSASFPDGFGFGFFSTPFHSPPWDKQRHFFLFVTVFPPVKTKGW